jgi:hypothetical protein
MQARFARAGEGPRAVNFAKASQTKAWALRVRAYGRGAGSGTALCTKYIKTSDTSETAITI